jgi:hypothetical protein
MRRIYLAILLMGGCLPMPAQTAQAVPPAKTDKPAITRQMLEQRLAELKAGKEQAVANVNAFEGAIQECSHWLDLLEPQKPKAEPKPASNPAIEGAGKKEE